MTKRTLLLFDVDGVLISPIGYKQSLIDTLDYFAALMGGGPVGLTFDEIAIFESLGMTNEWLSGPMCLAAIIAETASARPEVARATLDETLAAIKAAGGPSGRPDFTALARNVVARDPIAAHESGPVHGVFIAGAAPSMHGVLGELLADIFPPAGPVARVIQHYTLGSRRYQDIYGHAPVLETDSYLVTLDKPGLSPEMTSRLGARLAEKDGLGGVIFTARPTLPPADLPGDEAAALNMIDYLPEGELAAEALGLTDMLPLIGGGRMLWLAQKHGKSPYAYVKPSPVQALAAIGAAQTGEEIAALNAAADVAHNGKLSGPLAELGGQETEVVVFEDSLGGIEAAQGAVEMLRGHGVNITCSPVGIAAEPAKQEALARVASRVEASLDAGLEPYLS